MGLFTPHFLVHRREVSLAVVWFGLKLFVANRGVQLLISAEGNRGRKNLANLLSSIRSHHAGIDR